MKLLWSSRSPFVRKVMIVAHETGTASRFECERTLVAPAKPNAAVMALNPLNKLPTLILDDGQVLYDSRVIVEYLDQLAGGKVIPVSGRPRLEALRRQSLADGMLDFLLGWLGERNRPAATQSSELIQAFRLKLKTVLDVLERDAGALAASPYDIGHIAIGCALGYVDFRYAGEAWREGRPHLAAWYAETAARPSFRATEHADAY